MIEQARSSRIRSPQELSAFAEMVLSEASQDSPQIAGTPTQEIDTILTASVDLLQSLERAARPHPTIHEDTDIVIVICGPGEYSKTIAPYEEKKDRYPYPWARRMDRARVRAGVSIVHEVTAMRLGKPVAEVTTEDVARHGPWLHYAATSWENNHIRHVLAQSSLHMPSSKIFMHTFLDEHGNERPIINTATQMEDLQFPGDSPPRRIVIVSHAPHLVRIAFLMEKWKDRIPKSTTVQFFPLPTPSLAVDPYTLIELRGVFAEIYKKGTAAKTPFAFTLE